LLSALQSTSAPFLFLESTRTSLWRLSEIRI
jgi:hypothetical protein